MGQLVFQATLGGAVNLIGPNIAGTVNFTLPSADGTSGQALSTNGTGTLAFSSFATLVSNTFTGSQTLSAGTANGVTYLNGSKVLTSGSALTFDGTNLGVGANITASASSAPSFTVGTGSGSPAITLYSATNLQSQISFADATTGSGAYDGYILYDQSSQYMAFGTTATERMRLTSTGLGIGTSSPANPTGGRGFEISNASGASIRATNSATYLELQSGGSANYILSNGAYPLLFYTNGSERARITSAGDFLIGSTSTRASSKLDVRGDVMTLGSSALYYATIDYNAGLGFLSIAAESGGGIKFLSGTTEQARIDSSGNLLVGTTTASGKLFSSTSSASQPALRAASTSATYNDNVFAIDVDRNTTNNTFYAISYYNNGAAAHKFRVADSGNVTNTNNSYGAISDVKLKENIVDATPKLSALQNVRIVNYNRIGSEEKELGVIAQELEQVFPALVETHIDRDAENNDLGTTTKSVKYSVFVPMLIKAIQELKADFDAYKASHP